MQALPVEGKIFDAVIDDVNNDGLLDLVVTLRSQQIARIVHQTKLRQFEPGLPAKVTGVHADRLTLLPSPPHHYLLCAEGEGLLKVLTPDPAAGLKEVSRYPQPPAFAATLFRWPNWGQSLAVSPYAGERVTLVRNFRAETGETETAYSLGVANHTVPSEVTAVDLDNDGIEELLYTTRRTRTVWRISYPKDGQEPAPEKLWTAPEGYPRQVAVADLNGDGAPDIVVPLDATRKIAVLLNNGKGEFTSGSELPFPTRSWGPAGVVVAEQGGASLVVARGEKSLVFVRVEKNAAMRAEALELPLDEPLGQIMLLRDMDGDGNLDLVINTNTTTNSLRILYGPLWENVNRWVQQRTQSRTQSEGNAK